MHVVLIGADYEENLGIGMIGAAAHAAGHRVSVVPFADGAVASVTSRTLAAGPDVVGLSMQFQHRAHEFLALARALRAAGFSGHLTCGGHYPTLAAEAVLARHPELDSVVLHEGEQSFVELLAALAAGPAGPARRGAGRSFASVRGLAWRDEAGAVRRSPPRPLLAELDALPHALRYRAHACHVGVPFIPIMGARGCWGRCAFCSITSFYRDARARAGGRLLRLRSPDDIGAEMAALCEAAGGRAIFCFHDDNFLLPRPEDSMARVRAIRAAFEARCAGEVALIGKCRPDSLTPELAHVLAAAGVVRLYVGVENVSPRGAEHLARGMDATTVRAALAACREAGIFTCYNLLVFEPRATLDDVAQNLDFLREHAMHPVNFGRVEAYFGTALQRQLAAADNLTGSHLGQGYRIADDRAELLFRSCAAAFRQRNWDAAGVHNRLMGVNYTAKLLEHFYAGGSVARVARRRQLVDEAAALTRDIVLESADFLAAALDLARELESTDHDRVARETAALGLRIAEADGWRHAQLDRLYAELDAFGAAPLANERDARARTSRRGGGRRLRRALQSVGRVVAAGSLVATLGAAQGCGDGAQRVVDPDARPLDMPWVIDPDAGPLDHFGRDVVDPDARPLDEAVPRDAGVEFPVVDPLPPDGAIDATPGDALLAPAHDATDEARALARSAPLDRFVDSAPAGLTRSPELPLYDPPRVRLQAQREAPGGPLRVSVLGEPSAVGTRWQGAGRIEGEGRSVRWWPASDSDQIDVAVRTAGGISVASLRAREA